MATSSSPLFLFDGVALPSNPAVGYLEESEQLVEGTRSASGVTVAQPINRRINKFSGISFPILPAEDVHWLMQKVSGYYVDLTYYDIENDDIITRKFYFGDVSKTPYKWDNTSSPVQKVTWYKDVKVNLIDVGE